MINNKKAEIIKFRCSKVEKKIITSLAQQCGISLSNYCRQQAKKGKVFAIPKLSSSEVEYFKVLKYYSVNFNRMSNLIKNKDPSLVNEIRLLVNQLSELQKRIL